MELHEALAARVRSWREAGCPPEVYPAISEIVGYAVDGDGPHAPLRFLWSAQLRALETYWTVLRRRGSPRPAGP